MKRSKSAIVTSLFLSSDNRLLRKHDRLAEVCYALWIFIAERHQAKRIGCMRGPIVRRTKSHTPLLVFPFVIEAESFNPSRALLLIEHRVPGSAEECHLHALACVRLAQTLATPQARDHFAKLARSWIKLAEDLDRGRAFLDAESGSREQTG